MFTGLVEERGRVVRSDAAGGGRKLRIACRTVLEDLRPGDSVAVGGICLTAESRSADPDGFTAFATAETVRRTTLGSWRPGTGVNLERALRAADRLGGHLVQGHVDGLGRILETRRRGAAHELHLEIPRGLRHLVAEKGSLAVDGVSLTVGELTGSGCRLHLIPETLQRTTLDGLRRGDAVNLEVDLLARYVERILAARGRR
ncbi:MAG: riboflavin synthase [Candidatus Eisenbacteria bacterium]|nr:riboflavin synthase [Candidatus Eisenbacteria bacterium]